LAQGCWFKCCEVLTKLFIMSAVVTLHVYDVSTDPNIPEVNKLLQAIGTGAFHGGVEIYGKEWSYGYVSDGTGVFCCAPKGCDAHHYRESIEIGTTKMSPSDVGTLLARLTDEWPGVQYDLLRRNCVLFSDALCQELGVGRIPSWVTNLAGAGATLDDGFKQAQSSAQAAAIIAAAKAGEIDEKYRVQEKAGKAMNDAAVVASQAATQAAVLAAQASERAKELNEKHKIKERAGDAMQQTAAQASILAMQAANKASELDQQYQIQEKATGLAAYAAMRAQELAAKAAAKASELDDKYKIKEKAGDALTQAGTAASTAAGQVQDRINDSAAPPAQGAPAQGVKTKDGVATQECKCDDCVIA